MRRGFRRFVALGDSFTEGLDDLRPDGLPGGWADRVAAALAAGEPALRYANLAVRSLRVDQVVDRQLGPALAMRPDLASIAAGGNDILAVRFDLDAIAGRLEDAVAALTGAGATTVLFAGFDPTLHLPLGRLVARRTAAYNDRIAAIAQRHGAVLVDLWSMPELHDPRLWSRDRLHLSTLGHRHIANVVLDRLGVAAAAEPVSTEVPPQRHWVRARAADLAWSREHFVPWAIRKARGRSMGHGKEPKYPALTPAATIAAKVQGGCQS
jgi:lysophospholipase L1-like esterase